MRESELRLGRLRRPGHRDRTEPAVSGHAEGFVEPHVYRPYVEAVRGAAGNIPVLSVLGRLTSIADGEAAIAAGVCDMVGAARALIAEPQLVKNAYEGREDRSRTCIACNWCLESSPYGAAGCAINPASYRERLWGVDSFTPGASFLEGCHRGRWSSRHGGCPCQLPARTSGSLLEARSPWRSTRGSGQVFPGAAVH